jgi:hypothetical protein
MTRIVVDRRNDFYPWLQKIMEIPELIVPDHMQIYDNLPIDQKDAKMKENIRYSLQDRYKHIEQQQTINILDRLRTLDNCNKQPELQRAVISLCKQYPLYFVNMRAWTYNPRLQWHNAHMPFMTYPFQDQFICDVTEFIFNGWWLLAIEKSRDMWFSRLMCVAITWWFIFHDRSALIWSYKEDYVHEAWNMDSLFEKIFYIVKRLPTWMLPDDIVTKYMSVSSKIKWEKQIVWDAWENFGTWGRTTVMYWDEFALWSNDKLALRKTADITEARIIGWTPEWTMNEYGKIMTNHPSYKNVMIHKISLIRSLHPLKTQARYKYQQATRTALDLAKEIDISYTDSVTWQVYPNFLRLSRFEEFKYNPSRLTFRSFDFWLDMNVCIYAWVDEYWIVYIYDAVQRERRDIRKFWGLVVGKPTPWFNDYDEEDYIHMTRSVRYRMANGDFWDPYNADNWSTVDPTNTIRTLLQQYWINLHTNRKSSVASRIRTATLSLPRIVIHSSLHDFIASIVQSKYPQKNENSQSTADARLPIHDRNSHFRTAFEYLLDNLYDSNILQENTWSIVEV